MKLSSSVAIQFLFNFILPKLFSCEWNLRSENNENEIIATKHDDGCNVCTDSPSFKYRLGDVHKEDHGTGGELKALSIAFV